MPKPRIAILSMSYTEATDTMPVIISIRAKAEVLNNMETIEIIAAVEKYGKEVVGLKGDVAVGIKVNDEEGNPYLKMPALKERLNGRDEYIPPLG